MLKQPILKIFSRALNHVLSFDSEVYEKLTAFDGKVLAIEEPYLNLKFYLLFSKQGVIVADDDSEGADTTICGTPLALIQLAKFFGNGHKTLFSGKVTITGDLEFGQAVQEILNNLDIDWEEQLSQVTGDVIAHQTGNFVRNIIKFGQRNTDIFCDNLSQYLQDEINFLPSRYEVDDFIKEVDKLHDDIERITEKAMRIIQTEAW